MWDDENKLWLIRIAYIQKLLQRPVGIEVFEILTIFIAVYWLMSVQINCKDRFASVEKDIESQYLHFWARIIQNWTFYCQNSVEIDWILTTTRRFNRNEESGSEWFISEFIIFYWIFEELDIAVAIRFLIVFQFKERKTALNRNYVLLQALRAPSTDTHSNQFAVVLYLQCVEKLNELQFISFPSYPRTSNNFRYILNGWNKWNK